MSPAPSARPRASRPGLDRRAWLATALASAAGTAAFAAAPPTPTAGGWEDVPLNARKRPTVYRRPDGGTVDPVIEARADGSASMLLHPADVDLQRTPLLAWRWRLHAQPPRPDITDRSREDAAARVLLCFDGDRLRLARGERLTLALADALAGRPMPFATLMYVAAPGLAVGTLVPSPHTRRVQMVVVDGEPAGAGHGWRSFRRDVVADYRRAWGEPPGRLLAYGVMTDSDNTGGAARADYTGLRFLPAA